MLIEPSDLIALTVLLTLLAVVVGALVGATAVIVGQELDGRQPAVDEPVDEWPYDQELEALR